MYSVCWRFASTLHGVNCILLAKSIMIYIQLIKFIQVNNETGHYVDYRCIFALVSVIN